MKKNVTFKILMYSHDTYGLGHIRRTMAIASQLKGANINILILTGSPIAGRFTIPQQVDFVRIPGMIKTTSEAYEPLSIKINPTHALNIRKNIITATAKTFQPDLFIVDKEPLGLKKEVLTTLQWLRKSQPRSHTVLGLRDIMDDAEIVRDDWKKKGVYAALDTLYSEIWVYGIKDLYDPEKEYDIPPDVGRKMVYTGYIRRATAGRSTIDRVREEQGVLPHEKLIVVTTGGGGDGFPMMMNYLSMLDQIREFSLPYVIRSVLITGPFMSESQRDEVLAKSLGKKVRIYHFVRRMEKMIAAADLVVTMGGYNTLCEILSHKKLSLIIPRETPRKEQLIRARVFSEYHLSEYIPWNSCSPRKMLEKIMTLFEHGETYYRAIDSFKLTGIDRMRSRINEFYGKKMK